MSRPIRALVLVDGDGCVPQSKARSLIALLATGCLRLLAQRAAVGAAAHYHRRACFEDVVQVLRESRDVLLVARPDEDLK